MRRLALAVMIAGVSAAPSPAAWVWVYGGEKHVLMPPEEGRPPWADFADADRDGTPDPIITKVVLRLEDDEGQPITRIRLGRTVHLVAVPELGGMELEPLSVVFRLAGPLGPVEVPLGEGLVEGGAVGTAPAIYRGSYTLPEPPSREFTGVWNASVEVRVGEAGFDTAARSPMALRVLGPRETMPEKVGREVKGGLREAGREIKEFGEKVAVEVEAWLAAHKKVDIPGALKPVQPRATLGIVDRAVRAPGSPLAADEAILAPKRATALVSRTGPPRSLLVVPLDRAAPPQAGYRLALGYVVVEGVRPSGVADPPPLTPGSAAGEARVVRLVLEAEPGAAEGSVQVEGLDGAPLLTVPARVEWFGRVIWPGEMDLRVLRHPTAEADGLVDIRLVSAVPGGAARVEFTLPLVDAAQPAPLPDPPSTETPSTDPATEPT